MTKDQAYAAQMQQIAGGIIDTADPCWQIDDRPNVWDRARQIRSHRGSGAILTD